MIKPNKLQIGFKLKLSMKIFEISIFERFKRDVACAQMTCTWRTRWDVRVQLIADKVIRLRNFIGNFL